MDRKKTAFGLPLPALACSVALAGLAVMGLGGIYLPVHYYDLALRQGLETNYLRMPSSPQSLRTPQGGHHSPTPTGVPDHWRELHFGDHRLALPTRHPEYLAQAWVVEHRKKALLGIKLLSPAHILQLALRPLPAERWNLGLHDQKLFTLPLYQEHIQGLGAERVWEDLFTKDVALVGLWQRPWREIASFFFDLKHVDLVYGLYILKLRQKLLPGEIKSISYDPHKRMGIVELSEAEKSDEHRGLKREIWYFRQEGRVVPLLVLTRPYSGPAHSARAAILAHVAPKPSAESSADALYAEFRSLDYRRRIDQEGMVLMLAAWSHVMEKKEFLKEAIQFLERGKENHVHLGPLYDFALRRYGTTLSLRAELEDRESAQARLERKMRQELEAELAREGTVPPDADGNFQSDEDKVRYYLQKAKNSGKNSDDSLEILEK